VIGCRLGQPRPPTPADTRWPVPWLDFPEDAARTLALAARAGEAARRPPDPAPALSDVDPAAAQEALESAAPGAWLDALAVERLLLAYGLPLARARLVQEMAGDGLDLIVGATADPLFGPLVLAGIGGAQAELWRDSALALAPVGRRTAEGLWTQLRGARLLDGWRGSPAADRAALADVVVRIGRLAADQPLLAELDCNPVRALGPGRGVLILDARARRSAH
jgi:acyl-CoA synthetase (NDP forming)